MNLSYEKQMIIAMSQSIIQKYGVILSVQNLADIIGVKMPSLQKKLSNLDRDLPKYTQLKGKKVFMANDIAEWMVLNDLKFPKE